MKCSNCGKEFGAGTHCQHCGVDRVTGLANYNGYNNSGDSSSHNSSNYGASSNTTICFACGEIIPSNSEFCPYCSKQLYVTCPKCGNTYSSQFPACNKCGTNRKQYYKQQEAERQRKLREEEERRRKQREWEQSPEGKAKIEKERKRQEEEKTVNTIVYLIMVPIWAIMCYAGLKEGIPVLNIQIPEVWPNTFPTDIIMCLLLGYLAQYIITKFD